MEVPVSWGVDKNIYATTHELLFVGSGDSLTNLPQGFYYSPTNTLLVALAIAFVLLMTPGLALFYGGLVRRKSMLTIINQCVASIGITTLIWIFGGYSLAFGPSVGKGIIGDISTYFAFRNLIFNGWGENGAQVGMVLANFAPGVPLILHFAFQLAFAIITPPLMVGAFADRMKFKNYLVFLTLWQYFVYIPFCHWIWGGGFLAQAGVVDWAGGIVIHATCGFGALGASFVLGKRVVLKNEKVRPNNIPMTILGATLLFFGWFGFNVGGSGFNTSDAATWTIATHAWISTVIALAIGMVGFAILESIFNKNHKPTSIGLVTGAIAGLATITPAAGYVPLWASVPIALAAVAVCFGCCKIMHHSKHIEDALEVWGVHGMGGVTGSILIGAFAAKTVNPNLIYFVFGSPEADYGKLLGVQIGATALACAYSFIVTIIITAITQPRLSAAQQLAHIDMQEHGEDAYNYDYHLPHPEDVEKMTEQDQKTWHAKFGIVSAKKMKALSEQTTTIDEGHSH